MSTAHSTPGPRDGRGRAWKAPRGLAPGALKPPHSEVASLRQGSRGAAIVTAALGGREGSRLCKFGLAGSAARGSVRAVWRAFRKEPCALWSCS